jgi:hypothetical protein
MAVFKMIPEDTIVRSRHRNRYRLFRSINFGDDPESDSDSNTEQSLRFKARLQMLEGQA